MSSEKSKDTGISHITYPSKLAASSDNEEAAKNSREGSSETDKRLWLGNLDPKVTDIILSYGFHLLKLVQKYGTIHHFDFLFHRSGPNLGLPRGYAFVEFDNRESALRCMAQLDRKKIGERHLAIRWANQDIKDYPDEQTKLKAKLPALSVGQEAQPIVSKERAINAIEAKLRAMEQEKNKESFKLTTDGKSNVASSSASSLNNYKYYRPTANTNVSGPNSHSWKQGSRFQSHRPHSHDRKPYSRR